MKQGNSAPREVSAPRDVSSPREVSAPRDILAPRDVRWLIGVGLIGVGLIAAGLALPATSRAQDAGTCPANGFDICFPNADAGAPSVACDVAEAGAAAINACLGSICSGKATEPEPGFFGFCCAQGGAVQYDDFCVLGAQNACPLIVEHCASRCPPAELLTGTIALAAPPAACFADYPPAITGVCDTDPFCCTTSWDALCASAAAEATAAAAAGN